MEKLEEMRKLGPPPLQKMSDTEISKLIHDLQVDNIELETRNEELLKAQILLDESYRKSKAELQNILSITPDTIYRLNPDGYFTYVSPGVKNLGFKPDDLLGKHFSEIVHHDDQELAKYRFNERRIGERATHSLEIRIVNPDRENKTCEVLAVPILLHSTGVYYGHVDRVEGEKREYVGTQGIIRDITERKKSEEQINKLSRAVEQSPVTVAITDTKGDIEYVNPKFTQLTGYSLEEAIGQNARILKSGTQGPEVYKELWETITSGDVWYGEFHNKKKNGDLYWENASISPIRDSNGAITHFVAVKEDITERKKKDEQIKASLKEKEILLKEVHHRVKNNLQVISSLLNLQLGQIQDERTINLLKESQGRVRAMSLIHEELYQNDDLAKIDFAEYTRTLVSRLSKTYCTYPVLINVTLNIDEISLGIDAAIPCGLIINELFTNSLKYAFPGAVHDTGQVAGGNEQSDARGEICINFSSDSDKYTLIFSDKWYRFI